MSMDSTLATLAAALQTIAPARVVTREFKDFADRPRAELLAGVWTVLNLGVSSYINPVHTPGRQPVRRVLVVGQIELPEDSTGLQVEQAEYALAAEMEALAQAAQQSVPGLVLNTWSQSGQLETPYGWVRAEFEINPEKLYFT